MNRDEFKAKYFTDSFYWVKEDNFEQLQLIAFEMGLKWHTGDTDTTPATPKINNLRMFPEGFFQSLDFYSPNASYGEPVNFSEMLTEYESLSEETKIENDFDQWWNHTGSGIFQRKGEDTEEFTKRVTKAAWEASSIKIASDSPELKRAKSILHDAGMTDLSPEGGRMAILDLQKARLEFTEDEYPTEDHEERMEAARLIAGQRKATTSETGFHINPTEAPHPIQTEASEEEAESLCKAIQQLMNYDLFSPREAHDNIHDHIELCERQYKALPSGRDFDSDREEINERINKYEDLSELLEAAMARTQEKGIKL